MAEFDFDDPIMPQGQGEPLSAHSISNGHKIHPQNDGSASPASRSPSPDQKSPTPPRKSAKDVPIQLIPDLPVAREEALGTFEEISENWYMYKSLGRSRELGESMSCDCVFDPAVDTIDIACGHGSDCINRLTQVECLPEDCRCRSHCQNQRFQRKQYAPIEVVKTEKKGFGLRAEEDIRKDTFIYEYVGDVVGDASFKKRMREYAEEGIRHFYFMMLQKDEYIDATKHGGVARFANHSCNPNCYVAKWTVGKFVRMGIFAKRNILKNEELTFNYNVDRYGHQAQTCFCGEPNCVGFIGGKTQTDISTIDDLYLDALGITDENELRELKGTKKKRGKKLDDPDFMPTLRALVYKEVPKVIQAIRQTQSKKVLGKLLTRIKMTDDETALRQIMRLRGYSLMKNILEDYAKDFEMIILTLECMFSWPLIHLNKVEDSQVNIPVKSCAESENDSVKAPAERLLAHWDTLTIRHRIPKRSKEEDESPTPQSNNIYCAPDSVSEPEAKRAKVVGQARDKTGNGKRYDEKSKEEADREAKERAIADALIQDKLSKEKVKKEMDIIALAKMRGEEEAREKAAAVKAAEEAAAAKAEMKKQRAERRALKKKKKKTELTEEQKAAQKEKRLLKLIAAVVVKCMSKYGRGLEKEKMKKHAKELSQLILEKEKKSASFKEGRLDSLSDEKAAKIKKFSKEYIEKIVYKMKKAQKQASTSSLATPVSTLADTPPEGSGSSAAPAEMTVEEAMDLGSDSESEDEEDDGENDDEPQSTTLSTSASPSKEDGDVFMDDDTGHPLDMDVDLVPPVSLSHATDPRRRPPDGINGLIPVEHGLAI